MINGMKMMIAGIPSRKSPTMTSIATIKNMIAVPLWPATCSIQPDTTSGPRKYASTQPKADAAATALIGSA